MAFLEDFSPLTTIEYLAARLSQCTRAFHNTTANAAYG